MKRWLRLFLIILLGLAEASSLHAAGAAGKKVYILPIRENIEPSLVYIVRRGVKEAMDAKADLLVIDMDTNGGRGDSMEEIIKIIARFPGQTATYVDTKAFSAGALISFVTQKIYMAPQSVIGAAAPVFMTPGSGEIQKVPETMELKAASAISALIRANAEKHGHNIEVVDAMVKKDKELKIDGKVINEKGQLLTLTDKEAAATYGNPPKPLLSAGTVESLEKLLEQLGYAGAERHDIKPTGAERIGTWINTISPLLLVIGILGIYIEFKTPGFGVPGVIGIVAFALYFFGGYVSGLSGAEWVLVFVLGLALVIVELFVFPGTIALGIAGIVLMLVAIVMALVDIYPSMPPLPGIAGVPTGRTMPTWTWKDFDRPAQTLLIAVVGSVIGAYLLSRILPKTAFYGALVSKSASGMLTEEMQAGQRSNRQGQVGVALSNLRPGGKAQFGDAVLDVISQGDLIAKGEKVRIIGFSAAEAIVEKV